MRPRSKARRLGLGLAMVGSLHFFSPPGGRANEQLHRDLMTATGSVAAIVSSGSTFLRWRLGYAVQVLVLLHGVVVWNVLKSRPSAELTYVPDADYDELALVENLPVPVVETDVLVSLSGVSWGNLFLGDLTRSVSTLRAFDTSLNRLYNAVALGDETAAERQRAYVTETLLPAVESVMADAATHLTETMLHMEEVTVPLEQVQTYHDNQRASGFPAEELPVFRMVEATACEMMKADMLVLSAAMDRPEYSLRDDGLAPLLAVFRDTLAFLRTVDLSPAPASLVAVEGCALFRRGDVDGSGSVALTDAVALAHHLFLGGESPPCREASDSNDDGGADVSDAVFVLNWLFLGGETPPAPGPRECGADPSGSPVFLGCTKSHVCE